MIYLKNPEANFQDLKLAYAKPYAKLTHAYARAAKHNFFSPLLTRAYAKPYASLRNALKTGFQSQVMRKSCHQAQVKRKTGFQSQVKPYAKAYAKAYASLRKSLRKLTQHLEN